jgi:hypothetical protein
MEEERELAKQHQVMEVAGSSGLEAWGLTTAGGGAPSRLRCNLGST